MIARNIRQKFVIWQWLAVLLLLFAALPATASVQDIRVVGVGVDNSSYQAEQNAVEYARKRAVYLATRKLGLKNASKLVAKFTEDDFKLIVRGMNVAQTRRVGEVTYVEANVTIVDEALLRALRLPDDFGKPAVPNLKTRNVLILPVFVGHERSYLWEKENELRTPLADEIRRQSRGGVLLPGGDLDDLKLIDYQNALTVKSDELKPMFERYGAEEIIIAVLTLGPIGTMDPASVLLRRLKLDTARNEVLEIPPEVPEETKELRLIKSAVAIAGAVSQIASSTAERERALRAQMKQIKVRFAYATPKDLARMQEAVRAAPQVTFLDLPSIALAQVGGTIYLKSDEQALRENLTKQGIIVTSINDGWRLSVR